MSKALIGALVGAIILFAWSFLSWAMLNLHASESQYTEGQDAIMEVLSENLSEGSYVIPNVPPGTSPEDQQNAMQESIGKPWVQIHYRDAMQSNMGMNMFRAIVVHFICVFLLIWLLGHFADLNFKTTLLASLAVGLISYLGVSYIMSIWWETDSLVHLLDTIVSWGLVGAWLGWWLNR